MTYYQRHVFICTNQREDGRASCNDCGSAQLRDYAKQQVKAAGLSGKGKLRVNSAGCLDRCDQGPVMVIYPEATWYTFVDEEDIDEIIDSHLRQGQVVERLLLDADA